MLQLRPGFRAGPFPLVEEREKMAETAGGEYKVTFTLNNLTQMVYDRIDGYATDEDRCVERLYRQVR